MGALSVYKLPRERPGVTVRESNLFAYPRCLLVFTHVHDSEGDLVRLRAPHERPYNRTMSAMWIYKLPWETLSDLESHYICFEFVIIRVMGKCFVMNHAGQFQCSKEITWTCCHQKRKYCHFSTVKSCWEFMNIVLNALHDLAFLPEAFSIFNIPP